MRKFIRFTLVLTVVLALSACNFPPTAQAESSVVRLTVQVQNATGPFNAVDQVINYTYTVTNTGNSRLAGPIIITDPQRQITCPDVNTVGNKDGFLDFNESIICPGTYRITQADLTIGSVTNNAKANVGGIDSIPAVVTVPLNVTSSVLKLTKTANPTFYTAIGEQITYTYIITNTGTAPLPPSQFTITDNRLGPAFNCGPATTTPLLQNQSLPPCTATYVITQTDMSVASLTNSATASGGGAPASQAASATVTNLSLITATPTSTPPTNLPPVGSTVQHQVVKGEWLIQIARCYGANFEEVRNANPQIKDPHFILPDMTVTVPHVGSVSKIYGRPCITSHTVGAGDTWESIALKYNADVEVLKTRNGGALSAGRVLIIPLNSAGGSTAPLPPQPTFTPTATATSTAAPTLTFTPGPTATATATSTSSVPLLPDINPGAGSSSPAYLADYKGVLYFSADDGKGAGRELWKYDGTKPLETVNPATLNPSLVADINKTGANGSNPSNPAYLTVYKDVLYFQADDGTGKGKELWKFDITKPIDLANPNPSLLNPSLVKDINNGPGDSNPRYLTVYKDVLYFSADDGLHGAELFRYIGAGDPSGVIDLNPAMNPPGSSNPTYLTVYKDALYFGADDGKGAGQELWKYVDTAPFPVAPLADIATAPAKGSSPEHLSVYNGALYFSADDGTGAGVELWKYVDTIPVSLVNAPLNPFRVADIAPDPAKGSFPAYLTEYNGALYFSADDGKNTTGKELWKYVDTIPVSLVNAPLNPVVIDIWLGLNGSNPMYLTKYNGALYFSADAGDGKGVELRKYP